MRVGLSVVLGIVVMTTLAAPVQAETVVFFGVEFPDVFAEGEQGRIVDYEKDDLGLGYSAEYRHRGAITTFYLYDAGIRSIPDDSYFPALREQFEKARNDIRQVRLREGMELISKGTFGISDSARKLRLVCEGFDLDNLKPPRDSYLCLGVLKGKFLKVRTSMVRDSGSQTELRRFVGAWADMLWR